MELTGFLAICCISDSISCITGTVKNLKHKVTTKFSVKLTANYNVTIRNEK